MCNVGIFHNEKETKNLIWKQEKQQNHLGIIEEKQLHNSEINKKRRWTLKCFTKRNKLVSKLSKLLKTTIEKNERKKKTQPSWPCTLTKHNVKLLYYICLKVTKHLLSHILSTTLHIPHVILCILLKFLFVENNAFKFCGNNINTTR